MVITTIFHIFKKLKGRLSMLSRDMKNVKKTKIKLLDMATTMSQIKSISNGTNSSLDAAEEIRELEETAIKRPETNHKEKSI